MEYISNFPTFDEFMDMFDIDMEDDDGMLLQMGINGVKPSHIRKCVAEQSGFKEDTNTPKGNL